MKITNKHHKNSQIHSIPNKDTKIEHEISLDCKCQPKITIDNGHLLVEHQQVGKGDKHWKVRVLNFGIKYKL
jgi:hypothetical protein